MTWKQAKETALTASLLAVLLFAVLETMGLRRLHAA